jgi:hypothetical protein
LLWRRHCHRRRRRCSCSPRPPLLCCRRRLVSSAPPPPPSHFLCPCSPRPPFVLLLPSAALLCCCRRLVSSAPPPPLPLLLLPSAAAALLPPPSHFLRPSATAVAFIAPLLPSAAVFAPAPLGRAALLLPPSRLLRPSATAVTRRGQGQQRHERHAPTAAALQKLQRRRTGKVLTAAHWRLFSRISTSAEAERRRSRSSSSSAAIFSLRVSSTSAMSCCQCGVRFGNFYIPACQLQRQRLLSCATLTAFSGISGIRACAS